MTEQDELRRLREENARLKDFLTQHGIAWEEPTAPEPVHASTQSALAKTYFTTEDKITLFRGQEDVYPRRWESAKGTFGYSPLCGNEWKLGICQKPRVRCIDCNQRRMLPVTNHVIYDHLAGKRQHAWFELRSEPADQRARLISDLQALPLFARGALEFLGAHIENTPKQQSDWIRLLAKEG